LTSSGKVVRKPVKEYLAKPEGGWWSISGRIDRGTFVGRAVACWGGAWFLMSMLKGSGLGFGFLLILSAFVLGIMGCLQAIKRAHDFGASGWTVLLTLLPFVNVLWFFVLALVPGKQGKNAHGDVPEDAPVVDLRSAEDRAQDMARLAALMKDRGG
jgi:uncharacterized membrane protein YhaH (DUF805 family)